MRFSRDNTLFIPFIAVLVTVQLVHRVTGSANEAFEVRGNGKKNRVSSGSQRHSEGHRCIHDDIMSKVGRQFDTRTPQKYRIKSLESGSSESEEAARTTEQNERRRGGIRELATTSSDFEKMRITVDWHFIDNPGDDKDTDDAGGEYFACSGDNSQYMDVNGAMRSCGSGDVLSNSKRDYLKNTLVHDAMDYFEKTLSVVPVDGNLVLDSPFTCFDDYTFICCKRLTPDDDQNTGIDNSDFHLYVTARPTGGSILAWALTCQTDSDGRPISAQLNFDPSRISTDLDKRREQTITAMHEATHGLGFSASVFSNLGIIQSFNKNGKTLKRIVSPSVAEAAKVHYDCSDWGDAGGEIEDGGGRGTAGSHWEKRVLSDEYMTGRSEPNTVVSTFTLAFFADTGWYIPDYAQAESLLWGESQGCTFPRSTCDNWGSRYFCEVSDQQGCSIDYKWLAKCNLRDYGYELASHFQYFNDPELGGRDQLADFCPYFSRRSGGDCTDSSTTTIWFYGEQVGPSSMCFTGTWKHVASSASGNHHGCLKTSCDSQSLRLVVEFDTTDGVETLKCPSSGGTVDLQSEGLESFEGTIDCPPSDVRCTGDPCDNNNCDGHGTCNSDDGTCTCDSGYYGSDKYSCDRKLCPGQDSRDDTACSGQGECDKETGECDCDAGFSGDDCSEIGCPKGGTSDSCPTGESMCECSGRGSCNSTTGVCDCEIDWWGDACDKRECPKADNGERCHGGSVGSCNTEYGLCECTDQTNAPNGDGTVHYFGSACENRTTGPRPRVPLHYYGEPIGNNLTNIASVVQDSASAEEFKYYRFEVASTEHPVTLTLQVTDPATTTGEDLPELFASFEAAGEPLLNDHQFGPTKVDGSKGVTEIVFEDNSQEAGDFSSPGTMHVNVVSLKTDVSFFLNLTRDGCALLDCAHGAECSSARCICKRWTDPLDSKRTYGYSDRLCETPDCPGDPDCGGSRGDCIAQPRNSSDPPKCECKDTFEGDACQDYTVTAETFVPGAISSGRNDSKVFQSREDVEARFAGVRPSDSDATEMQERFTVTFVVSDELERGDWHYPFLLDPVLLNENYGLNGTLGMYIKLDGSRSPLADPLLLTRTESRPTLTDHDMLDTTSWAEAKDIHEISATLNSDIYFGGVLNGKYGRDVLRYDATVEISNGCPPGLEMCSQRGSCDPSTKSCICDSGWGGVKCDTPVTELETGTEVVADNIPIGGWRYFVLPLASTTNELEIVGKDTSVSRRAQPVVVAAFDKKRRATSLGRLRDPSAFYDYDGYTRIARGATAQRSEEANIQGGNTASQSTRNEERQQKLIIKRDSSSLSGQSAQFLYVGVQNVPQAAADATVKLTVTARHNISIPAECQEDCSNRFCRGRGEYVLVNGAPECRCNEGWSKESWCASPRYNSLQNIPSAAQSISFLCSICKKTNEMNRGEMQIFRVSQPLQAHIGLRLTARAATSAEASSDNLSNVTHANPSLLVSQRLPRSITDFAFISSTGSAEESLTLGDISLTGSYFFAVFANSDSTYTASSSREQVAEPDRDAGSFAESVGNWLIATTSGNLVLAFICVLAFLFLSCFSINRLCKGKVLEYYEGRQTPEEHETKAEAAPLSGTNPIAFEDDEDDSSIRISSKRPPPKIFSARDMNVEQFETYQSTASSRHLGGKSPGFKPQERTMSKKHVPGPPSRK
eukprot:gb/GECG01001757.1/.p1 GENE.gb/GECG01001757.1/~~gb/GECG01001757.1/.p1  ORF type:complete len:1684 (+),score=177.51 gb/GECG01001757.1/:1-5052(+)